MGKIVPMPDIEYRSWVNLNKEILDQIFTTGRVSQLWLNADNNRQFLVRYAKELGFNMEL